MPYLNYFCTFPPWSNIFRYRHVRLTLTNSTTSRLCILIWSLRSLLETLDVVWPDRCSACRINQDHSHVKLVVTRDPFDKGFRHSQTLCESSVNVNAADVQIHSLRPGSRSASSFAARRRPQHDINWTKMLRFCGLYLVRTPPLRLITLLISMLYDVTTSDILAKPSFIIRSFTLQLPVYRLTSIFRIPKRDKTFIHLTFHDFHERVILFAFRAK